MAQNHIVTCHACGQMFDTFRGGYYNAGTAQYTCRKCGRSPYILSLSEDL